MHDCFVTVYCFFENLWLDFMSIKFYRTFPRRFDRGSDNKGPATIKIKENAQEGLHPAGRPVNKFVLRFTETPRGVILTRSLALQLAEILGDDTASWKDRKITLYPEPMNVAGRLCVAIRPEFIIYPNFQCFYG
jgi:hypothetical protein